MNTIDCHQAQEDFDLLLDRVAAGEEFVITREGWPVARLVACAAPRRVRIGGQWRGQVRIGDDFDAPLPRDVGDAFGG